jgi:hypothetical protein
MTHVQIERDLSERLISGRQTVQLRDEEGRLIGFFVPAGEWDPELKRWAEEAFTDDEIRAAQQETGGSTWKEIRDELEKRWPST